MLAAFRRNRRLLHQRDTRTRWLILGLGVATLSGAAVRWSFLEHPMRYDEAMNYLSFTSRAPQYIATHYNPNNHVLHSLMVRFASHWLGTSPRALRLATFVAGVLLIPLAAWMAWSLFASRWVALVTAFAVAGSSQLVEYSTNARGYMWLTVFTTICVICTRHALTTPHRSLLWWAWGCTAALGAYTLPLMVYPACGLLAAVAITALLREKTRQRRWDLLSGMLIAAGVCGALTLVLYLPILIVQGPGPTWETRRMTYDVWGPRVGSFGSMLRIAWQAWTRDAGLLWRIVLPVGAVAFVLSTMRRRPPDHWLPVIMITVALAIVGLQGAPLRSRAWLPVLPVFLACAVQGMRMLCPQNLPARGRRLVPVAIGTTLSMAALLSLDNVRRERYLCSEPNVLVDVERVIEEWNVIGGARCALVMRFTPAARYYRLQKNLAAPPAADSPDTQRALIVVEHAGSLADRWNDSVDGYLAYQPPVLWKKLSRCTLFVADRTNHVARAGGGK